MLIVKELHRRGIVKKYEEIVGSECLDDAGMHWIEHTCDKYPLLCIVLNVNHCHLHSISSIAALLLIGSRTSYYWCKILMRILFTISKRIFPRSRSL